MSNYFSRYCALISSAEQLEYCRRAQSLDDLLVCIKALWNCNQLDNNALLGELNRCNQIPIDGGATLFGNWLPYRYQPKRYVVNWLIPVGHATEPFHDEYISRCRQRLLLNQIIQPCTSPEFTVQQGIGLADVIPAGFIFHLSRCGSTLVSGCLSELKSTCVFSEPPLLTELLLDKIFSLAEREKFLRAFINIQAAAFPNRPHLIIKWNAWDIFHWELIRTVYPQVPVIFLVRNPVEILASHHRFAGRHMMGDPSLVMFDLAPVPSDSYGVLDFRVRVLHWLFIAMIKCGRESGVVKDYRHLTIQQMTNIIEYFDLHPDDETIASVAQRMQYNAKALGQQFYADSAQKRDAFSADEKLMIENQLLPLYQQLDLSAS